MQACRLSLTSSSRLWVLVSSCTHGLRNTLNLRSLFSTYYNHNSMSPPSPNSNKRKAGDNRLISPPPVKRKTQSTISKGAVASFFTPTSQKPKDRTVWSERAPDNSSPPTLLVARFEPENLPETEEDRRKRRKIAAFDFDSTLIVTSSGKKFGNDAGDWKWWDPLVPIRLKKLYQEEGYAATPFLCSHWMPIAYSR
jgi:hypothetical protein